MSRTGAWSTVPARRRKGNKPRHFAHARYAQNLTEKLSHVQKENKTYRALPKEQQGLLLRPVLAAIAGCCVELEQSTTVQSMAHGLTSHLGRGTASYYDHHFSSRHPDENIFQFPSAYLEIWWLARFIRVYLKIIARIFQRAIRLRGMLCKHCKQV